MSLRMWRAFKMDAPRGRIGFVQRLRQRIAGGGHAQYTAARRHELAVLDGGPGVVDRHLGRVGQLAFGQAGDLLALLIGDRIPAGSQHHAGRRAVAEFDLGFVQRAVVVACMMVSRSLSSSGSTTCASGSPKRQLYSMTFGPSGVIISPKYRQPLNGQPSAAMAATVGLKIFSMHTAATSGV